MPAQPYIGEIMMWGGNFAPAGWAFCDGQEIPINENDALFTLIGTTYGGDGEQSFALPNLQSRVPIHQGNGFTLAQMAGVEQVTVTVQQHPIHSHALLANEGAASATNPSGNIGGEGLKRVYSANLGALVPMAGTTTPTGGSQPHENTQPFLVINFVIALFGVFPQQS